MSRVILRIIAVFRTSLSLDKILLIREYLFRLSNCVTRHRVVRRD